MKNNWLKNLARDFVVLGSVPFYVLVIIRSIIGNNSPFVYRLIIAAAAIFILNTIIKNSNLYIARGFVLVLFTSMYYEERLFTIFAFFVWLLGLPAAYYLKRKLSFIVKGIIIGLLSSLISYYGASFL